MDADAPRGPLYACLSASGGDSGARVVRGGERPSGARSAIRVGGVPAADTPPRGSSGPVSAPQRPDGAQDPRHPQRAADGRVADPPAPVQLTLPAELLAAVLLPVPTPSARRRGRPVHSVPDISDYQPEENP